MERFVKQWKRVPAAVRKPLILLLGTIIVILGLILIPLPGPGWLVVFAGLALLSTEFAAAEKLRDWTWKKLKKLLDAARYKTDELDPKKDKKPPKA